MRRLTFDWARAMLCYATRVDIHVAQFFLDEMVLRHSVQVINFLKAKRLRSYTPFDA